MVPIDTSQNFHVKYSDTSSSFLPFQKRQANMVNEFNALPLETRKRRAVLNCKNENARKLADFPSPAHCLQAAMDNDFTAIIEAIALLES